ncbi:hypothetical protein [Paludisphaera rhizosphaerae]|uniref:hypothetical protein n=1 Tax=Paludisphaera rhizosphaerae TaxID=2711216 RepID=UPI0013EC437C|nr:hypothetical protein [Paludisphaera rhizosphaerae]
MEIEAEIERLKRLVEATAETLGGASPRTLKESPFRRFGRQYNKLRDETARLLPNLLGLMPSRVPVGRKAESGDTYIDARYLEMHCYLVQLGELLTPAPGLCSPKERDSS